METDTENPSWIRLQRSLEEDEIHQQAALAIFSAYRRDDFANPEVFLIELGVVLEEYPDGVIAYISSPRTGIVRTAKYVPTLAEIIVACDDEVARQDRIKRYAVLPKFQRSSYERPADQQGRRANVLIRPEAPQYSAMMELSKTLPIEDWREDRDGIWIGLGCLEGIRPKANMRPVGDFAPPALRDSDRAIEASPEMLKLLKERDDQRQREKHWSEQ